MKRIFLITVCIGILWNQQQGWAHNTTNQEEVLQLRLKDAIDIALSNNFDIRIVEQELAQSIANNTSGNAGMLPTISAIGGLTGSLSNTKMEFASGDVQKVSNGESIGANAAIQLNWVLFDGMRMFIQKKRLGEMEKIGHIALEQQIQNTIADVIQTYAEVVRQKQQSIALDTALSLAKVRLDLAKAKFETGSAAKTDYLQAQVDYNANKTQQYKQQLLLRQSKDSLMLLLGRSQLSEYDVEDSLHLNTELKFSEKNSWIQQNFNMQLAYQQKKIAQQDLDLIKGKQYPQISLNAGYNLTFNQSAFGFVMFNQNVGPQANLQLNLPIFDGFNIQREKKIARLEIERQNIIIQQVEKTVNMRYLNQWRAYDAARKILSLEQENITYAEENVMIQQARFRVGVANALELREAENSYIMALTRLTDAAYNLKVAEIKLLESENKLIKNNVKK